MPAFRALIDGYRRFRQETYNRHRTRYDALTHKGQAPDVMVIACCDSRVDPTVVFDAAPGQMFVLRNVANLVPPFEAGGGQHSASAAIQYAVTELQVHHIVVLGHANCGGIAAALDGAFDSSGTDDGAGGNFIGKWMAMVQPAREKVLAAYEIMPDMDPQRALEHAAIRQSVDNLRTFPFVRDAEAAGHLKLHGAYFGIADGILQVLDPDSGRFAAVELDWDTPANDAATAAKR